MERIDLVERTSGESDYLQNIPECVYSVLEVFCVCVPHSSPLFINAPKRIASKWTTALEREKSLVIGIQILGQTKTMRWSKKTPTMQRQTRLPNIFEDLLKHSKWPYLMSNGFGYQWEGVFFGPECGIPVNRFLASTSITHKKNLKFQGEPKMTDSNLHSSFQIHLQ